MDFAVADAIRRQILDNNDPVTAAVLLGNRLHDDADFYAALHGREIAPGVHVQNPGPDANRMTDKYMRRTAGAAQDYVTGMQNPRRDPVQAAVKAAGKYANRVQEAIRDGSYEKGVRSQNYAEAVAVATGDGGAAYTAGIAKRESKVSRTFADLAPRMGALSQAIQNMPQDTEAQREQRLLAARRGMVALGKTRRGVTAGR